MPCPACERSRRARSRDTRRRSELGTRSRARLSVPPSPGTEALSRAARLASLRRLSLRRAAPARRSDRRRADRSTQIEQAGGFQRVRAGNSPMSGELSSGSRRRIGPVVDVRGVWRPGRRPCSGLARRLARIPRLRPRRGSLPVQRHVLPAVRPARVRAVAARGTPGWLAGDGGTLRSDDRELRSRDRRARLCDRALAP
jgi:hypothetical protein